MKTVKINVTRIDKTALFEGKNGKYLDAVLWDKPDEYGNGGFITQDIGRARREAGERGPIIGNWKEVGTKSPMIASTQQSQASAEVHEKDDQIPF